MKPYLSNNTAVWLINPYLIKNVSFDTLEELYASFGFTRLSGFVYITVFVGCATLGLVLNTLSLVVFARDYHFKAVSFYFYFKVLTFTSLLANLSQIGFGLNLSRGLLVDIGNSIYMQLFMAYFYSMAHSTLTCYKFIMDAVILVDRIGSINSKVAKLGLLKAGPVINSIAALLATILLILPQYFVFAPYKYFIYDGSELRDFYVTDTSSYARAPFGKRFINWWTIGRSISICFIDIILNVYAFMTFRTYFFKKHTLSSTFHTRTSTNKLTNQTQLLDIPASQELWKREETDQTMIHHVGSTLRRRNRPSKSKSAEKHLNKMVVVLCSVSVCHQILHVLNSVYLILGGGISKEYSTYSIFTSNMASVLRHASNFFVYYYFDKNFRRQINKIVGLKQRRRCDNRLWSQ